METFPTGKGANKPDLTWKLGLLWAGVWIKWPPEVISDIWFSYHYQECSEQAKKSQCCTAFTYKVSHRCISLLSTLLHKFPSTTADVAGQSCTALVFCYTAHPQGSFFSPYTQVQRINSLSNYNVKLLLKSQNRWPALTWCASHSWIPPSLPQIPLSSVGKEAGCGRKPVPNLPVQEKALQLIRALHPPLTSTGTDRTTFWRSTKRQFASTRTFCYCSIHHPGIVPPIPF